MSLAGLIKAVTGINLVLDLVDRFKARREAEPEVIGMGEEGPMDQIDFHDRVSYQLVRDEGMRLKPYHCTAGALTIGVGRNLDDRGITEAEARLLLRNDLLIAESEASGLACYRKLNEPRRAVLVNMVFNLGISRFLSFRKFIAALNEERYEVAAAEMLDSQWAGQVGARALRLAEQMRKGIWIN